MNDEQSQGIPLTAEQQARVDELEEESRRLWARMREIGDEIMALKANTPEMVSIRADDARQEALWEQVGDLEPTAFVEWEADQWTDAGTPKPGVNENDIIEMVSRYREMLEVRRGWTDGEIERLFGETP